MTNIVIDLSNFYFRSLFIVSNYGSKGYTFNNQYELDQLMRKVSTDISYVIRQLNPSRVIIAVDSRSWRKEISIDENDGYKANREKSGNINWDNIFNSMKEFGDILDSNGFVVTKIERAEADDIIALWVDELLHNQKQHVIMVSSDEDLRQLIKSYTYEDKTIFSTVYNPFATGKHASKKLYIPDKFEEWLETSEVADIFNRAIDVDKEDFKRLRDKEGVKFELIDGDYVALKKIFCGDDGDNVPSIYSWINEKGKTIRITESKFKKIIESINAKHYLDLSEKSTVIYDQLQEISGQQVSFRSMLDRLNRQIKLVVLSRNVFPREIVQSFDDQIEEQLQKPMIHPQNWNMNSILEGTRYVKNKNYASESSIFREIDQINSLLNE